MSPASLLRVLLVEDTPVDVLLFCDALGADAEHRYEITDVARLEDAITHLRTHACDVVLLDLGLPDSTGIDTFRSLRAVAATVPTLVLTGLDDEAVGIRALQMGAQDYLVKGHIEPTLLRRTVRYAIERQRTAAALAASEERFQLAVTGSSAGLWDCNVPAGTVYLAPRYHELLGFADGELPALVSELRSRIHPDDQARELDAWRQHLTDRTPYDIELRMLTQAGEWRWFHARGQALWDEHGEPFRMLGWMFDITSRKQAEAELMESREQLRRFAARLLTVREADRTRIAREIHDELGQQLTGLKMDLGWIDRKLPQLPPSPLIEPVRAKLVEAVQIVDGTIDTVRRIAIELRPGTLDSLGLAEAIRDEARRIETRDGIRIALQVPTLSRGLSSDLATAFFRIFQELMTNILRHAAATRVEVFLREDGEELELEVADNGRGFAPASAAHATALGLLGMRERAALVGAQLSLESAPGAGTRVLLRAPFVRPPDPV